MTVRSVAALFLLACVGGVVSTILGVHNVGLTHRTDVLSQLGVTATRLIVGDTLLEDEGRRQNLMDNIATVKADGVDVIISITFNNPDGTSKHRVPAGDDWDHCMGLAEVFLRDVGPNIAAVVLGNEPTDDYSREDFAQNHTTGHIPALYWIRQLAKRLQAVRSDTGDTYLIIAPDVGVRSGNVHKFPHGLGKDTANFIKQMLIMAEDEGLDAVDCHLHMANISLLKAAVEKVQSLTSVPLVALEWSQAPIVQSGWLQESQVGPFGMKTHKAFMEQCYKTPVTEEEWNDFMKSNPYDEAFMQEAYQHMKESGFLYATYGAAFQYRNVNFDSKQLFATKTVTHNAQALPKNEPLHGWFQALVQNEAVSELSLV